MIVAWIVLVPLSSRFPTLSSLTTMKWYCAIPRHGESPTRITSARRKPERIIIHRSVSDRPIPSFPLPPEFKLKKLKSLKKIHIRFRFIWPKFSPCPVFHSTNIKTYLFKVCTGQVNNLLATALLVRSLMSDINQSRIMVHTLSFVNSCLIEIILIH